MGKILIQLAIIAACAISLSQSATLNCTFSGTVCSVASITPVTSADETISVVGKPSTYTDTTTLGLAFGPPSIVNYVPTKAFEIFPNLQSMTFSNASVTNIVTNAFRNCGKLMSIGFTQNNFDTVPASFASTCINVTTLMFMQNGIKSIHNDALKGLTYLTMFYASYNNLTCIPPGLFRNTPIVQYIDLSYNQISEIDKNAFKGLANLNSLNLGSNKLVHFPAFDLTLTGSSMSFNIMADNNQIQAIAPSFITKLFSTRSGMNSIYIMFMNSQNASTCIPPNYSSIGSYNWPVANISLPICYANWKDEYETTPVSCASAGSTETTTKKFEGGNNGFWPWSGGDSLFAILSNTKKNFTANVSFF